MYQLSQLDIDALGLSDEKEINFINMLLRHSYQKGAQDMIAEVKKSRAESDFPVNF